MRRLLSEISLYWIGCKTPRAGWCEVSFLCAQGPRSFGAMAERLADRLDRLDKEVRQWGQLTRKKLRERLITLDLEERTRLVGEKQLVRNLRSIVRKKQGDLESVAFSFPRHGIFLEHGVGKHRPIGSAAAARAAKPWLKPVLGEATEELADLLEETYADLVAAELRILIPGIIDTRVQGNAQRLPDIVRASDGTNISIDPSFF